MCRPKALGEPPGPRKARARSIVDGPGGHVRTLVQGQTAQVPTQGDSRGRSLARDLERARARGLEVP